jgi:hypothetical protein
MTTTWRTFVLAAMVAVLVCACVAEPMHPDVIRLKCDELYPDRIHGRRAFHQCGKRSRQLGGFLYEETAACPIDVGLRCAGFMDDCVSHGMDTRRGPPQLLSPRLVFSRCPLFFCGRVRRGWRLRAVSMPADECRTQQSCQACMDKQKMWSTCCSCINQLIRDPPNLVPRILSQSLSPRLGLRSSTAGVCSAVFVRSAVGDILRIVVDRVARRTASLADDQPGAAAAL